MTVTTPTTATPHQPVQPAGRTSQEVIRVVNMLLGIMPVGDRRGHEFPAGRGVVARDQPGNRLVETVAIRLSRTRPSQTQPKGGGHRERQWHPSPSFETHGLSLT